MLCLKFEKYMFLFTGVELSKFHKEVNAIHLYTNTEIWLDFYFTNFLISKYLLGHENS